MASDQSDEILTDFSPFLRVYKDGRVERIFGSPFVPPSPEGDEITGVSSKDITISTELSARLYLPKLNNNPDDHEKLPILVYYHGGAFCVESAFSFGHQRYLNLVVSEARALCISVEYRLAPEHLLPAAYEDSWAALQWVASHLVGDGVIGSGKREPWLIKHGDFSKVYLGGDSAGGNIVHNICMRAGVESLQGDLKINGGLLCFPGFWGSCYEEKSGEQSPSQKAKIWNFVYPTAPGGIDNPMRNPLAEDAPSLSQLACLNLLVIIGEKDVLKQVTVDYIDALRRESEWKGKLEFLEVLEEGHCFQLFNPESGKAKFIVKIIASFIEGTLFDLHPEFDGMTFQHSSHQNVYF